jgi:hypothetical protein
MHVRGGAVGRWLAGLEARSSRAAQADQEMDTTAEM